MQKKFNIKNYTTEIAATKSIAEIEELLAAFGADAVMKEFTADGKVKSLHFKLQDKSFKLPANINGVKEILFAKRRSYHGRDSMKNRDEKSYKVAWRILKDWLHAQLSLIYSGQAFPDEIFLPYLFDGKRTLYQKFADEGKLIARKSGVKK